MKAVLVNTHDVVGGAERCSHDLATGLHRLGENVRLYVGGKYGTDPFTVKVNYRYPDYKTRFFLFEKFGLTDTTLVSPILTSLFNADFRNADVYNIHNMHGAYWNFWTLPILARRSPVVLTLHDEWFLTGDCAYTYGCERWQEACGACPQLTGSVETNRYAFGGRDLTAVNVRLKRSASARIPRDRMVIVCPSRWLAQRAQASHLSRFDIRHIEYGVDLEIFSPRPREESRRRLGLPMDKRIVCFMASNLFDRRKNFHRVIDLIEQKQLPSNCMVVCAGKAQEGEIQRLESLSIRYLGYLSDKGEITNVLRAADASLVISEADNLPYVCLEALACGCPVLGSQAGGMPELVEDGVNGWLLPSGYSSESLARLLHTVTKLPQDRLDVIGSRARSDAEKRFSMDLFVSNYRDTFGELIESCASHS